MNSSETIAVISEYYEAMSKGNFERVVELHSSDLVCWMSGNTIVSGKFSGRDNLYAHMGKYVLGALEVGAESYVKESRVAVIDGDYAVGLLHGGLPTKDKGRYDQFYLQIFRIVGGQIREIVELFDTVMVETVLMRKQLKIPRTYASKAFSFPEKPGRVDALQRGRVRALGNAFLKLLAATDFNDLRSVVTEDVTVRVIGSTPISGVSKGVDSLLSVVNRGVREQRVICSDNSTACIVMKSADMAYKQQYGMLIGVRDELIDDICIFLDTVEVEREIFQNAILPYGSKCAMPEFDIAKALQ